MRPESPAAYARIASNGSWRLAPHLEILNFALTCLAHRQAPASFLRRLAYSVDGKDRQRLLSALQPYADDDMVPFKRLIIEMPPRHGKSELTSRHFPAWYLGTNPSHRVILASYESAFARSWGRKARDGLREYGPELFGVEVGNESAAANDWTIKGTDGGMFTTGVGGPITGRGGDLLIIDDGVKNAEEAASPTIQQSNADWFDSTFYTRAEPDAVICVMGTRWHEKDIIGHILEMANSEDEVGDLDDEVWYVLKLPALAERDDILGRQPDEALWPERYPLPTLQRIKQRIGSYFFGALFQQRPTSEEGAIFKRGWWRYYDKLPDEAALAVVGYVIVDTAGYDDKTTGDYAAIAVVIKVGKDLYWMRVERGHWEFPTLKQKVADIADEYGWPILIEETPWAKPLIQSLQNERSGVVAFKIEGKSKITRAQAASPYHESGNFWLPRRASWVPAFVEEHAAFPTGANDDMVDTTSMAVLRMLLHVDSFDYEPPRTRTVSYGAPRIDKAALRQVAVGMRSR